MYAHKCALFSDSFLKAGIKYFGNNGSSLKIFQTKAVLF